MERERSVRNFITVWVGFSALLLAAVLVTDKMALHLAMHPLHSPFTDTFFSGLTHLGDGLVPTGIAIFLLATRPFRSFLMVGLSCGFSAIITQFLKQVVFSTSDRPHMFKQDLVGLHWVEGLELHHHYSFPSGHATAAFSLCFALAVLVARPTWGYVFAYIALALAYSRVYLSQHFTEDILAGAAIGTVTAYVVYRWLYVSDVSRRTWLQWRPGYLK